MMTRVDGHSCAEMGGECDGNWSRGAGRDAEAETQLAKQTLINRYNERPDRLDLAHKELDEAVFAAYGWPNELTDEEILEKPLGLNLERAPAERGEEA